MTLDTSLDALETAGLVQAVAKEPETEYEFRHGLLQETAYGLLLKRERKQLHQQVGAAIEDRYPERTKEMAPILANHFLKGGHQKKALQYLRLAGENARNRFANAEALEHFTSALEVTRELNQPLDEADLLRERGLTFEIVGEFEAAQEDFEAGLSIGEELEETKIQWSALLDLGKLWAAKDYDLSGDYFKEALALARKIDDAELIARSLNRLGNWHINVGNPKQAQSHHREALEIFEALDDREGIAETLDFLGMSSMLSGDLISGAKYYERAIDLLRSINDKQRLVSSLVPYALRYNDSMAEPVVGADVAPKEPLANYDEAIELARELGWRAGESFALWSRAFLLNSLGRLDDAHNSGHKGLKVAQEINHTQWMAAANCTLSRTYLEKMDLATALQYAEHARKHAFDIGSRLWSGIASAFVAFVHLAAEEIEQAEKALSAFEEEDPGMEMLGDRMYWMARSELLLRRDRNNQAIELLDRLIDSAPNFKEGKVIPRLFRNRGLACMKTNDYERARGQFEPAIARCRSRGISVLQWRLHGDLAQLEVLQGHKEAAKEQFAAGHSVVEEIAENLADPDERRFFREQALEQLRGELSAASTNGR